MRKTIAKIALVSMILSMGTNGIFADGIAGTNQYAWGENTGWINFKPTNGNIDVTPSAITGNAWGENTGWINMQPTNGGVSNTCAGVLNGNAWGESHGWISFSGATIDANGFFQGTATDASGGDVVFSGTNFDLQTDWRPDCTPPSVPVISGISTDTGSSSSDYNTSDNTLTISGTGEANSTVEVYINGISVGTTNIDSNGDWTFDHSGTTLADANYDVTVKGVDANGNMSVQSNIIDVEIDTTLPSAVTITSPYAGESTNDTTPVVEGTGEPGAAVSVVSGSSSCTATVNSSGIYSCELAPALTEGNHTISVTQTDTAGNTSPASATNIEVDTTFPNAPSVHTELFNTDTPNITGEVTLGTGETLSIAIDGEIYTQADSELTLSGSTWTLAIPTVNALDEGTFSVDAVVTDSAGNATTDVSTSEVSIDTIAPNTPVVNSPTDGTTTNDTTPQFTGTGEAGSIITVTDGNGHTCTDTVDISGNWSCNISPALADGATPTFTTTQTDLAGNTSTGIDTDVIIDTTAPTAPTVNNLLSNSTTPTITGMVQLNTGETLSVIVDGETYTQTGSALTVTGSTWSLVIPTGNEIAEGTHEVTATVSDLASNTTTDNGTNELTLDLSAPVNPTINGPTNGAPVTGTAEAVSTVIVSTPSGATCTTVTNSSGTYSCTLSPTPVNGENVTATSTDVAGNSSSATEVAGIDTLAPADPVIESPTQGSPVIGTAEPNTSITLTTPSGSSCTATVTSTGSFTCDLEADPVDGETITSTITDAAGNTNTSVAPYAIDLSAPGVPVVTGISDDSGDSNSDYNTFDNTLAISGTGEANSSVEVYINGIQVGTTPVDTNGDWTLDYTGIVLTDGNYDITTKGIDSSGNASAQSNIVDVIIDTTVPNSVVISTPSNGESTNDTTPNVAGTGEAGAQITVSGPSGESCTTTVGTDGIWSCDISPALNEGNNTLSVIQTDTAGNSSIPTTVSVDVDTTVPDTPTVDLLLDNNSTPEITGTVDLASGEALSVVVDLVVYVVGDGNLSVSGNDWTLTIPNSNALDDGAYEVNAIVTDSAGNTSTDISTAEVSIDTVSPSTPVIVAPTTGSSTNDTTPNVAGTGEPSSVITVTDGDGHTCTTTVDTNGNWACNVSPDFSDGDTPTLSVNQTDMAGNSSPSDQVSITIDTTAPTIPTVNSQLGHSTTPTITGMVELLNGDTMEVVVGSETYTPGDGNLTVASGFWTLNIPGTHPLTEGSFDVVVSVTDTASNATTDSSTNEVKIDLTNPVTPTIVTPTNGGPVTGIAEPGSDIVVTTPSGATCSTTTDVSGNYSCILIPTPVDGEDVSVVSTDLAGNTSSETILAGIDITPPNTPTLISPTQGAPATGTAEPGISVTLTTPSGATCITTADTNGNYSCNLSPNPLDGEDVTILVQDAAGNTTTITFNNAVDITAPTDTTLNNPTNGNPASGTAEPGVSVNITTPSGSTCTTTADINGDYSCILSPNPIHGEDAVVTTTDSAGNYNSIFVTEAIDTVTPNLPSITSPDNGITTGDNTPSITGIAEPGATVEVYVDGTNVGTTVSDTNTGEYNFTLPIQSDGSHTIQVQAIDTAGNVSGLTSAISIIVDTIAATIVDGSLEVNENETNVNITWATNEPTSARVEFGLTQLVDESTGEFNVAPRTVNHSTTLSNLLSCTTYFYETFSTDVGGNEISDGVYKFTTTGCIGDASIETETTTNVVLNSLGTPTNPLELGTATNEKLSIDVPVGYNDTNTCSDGGAYFQMKEINKGQVVSEVGVPVINDEVLRTYELSAYCNTGERVTAFDEPLTITAGYPGNNILDVNEQFMKLHSYNEVSGKWEELNNCSIDKDANTITCETPHFSTFGIFIQNVYTAGGGSSSTDGNLQGDSNEVVKNDNTFAITNHSSNIIEGEDDSTVNQELVNEEDEIELASASEVDPNANVEEPLNESDVEPNNAVEENTNNSEDIVVNIEESVTEEIDLGEDIAKTVVVDGEEKSYSLKNDYDTCPIIDNLLSTSYHDNHFSGLTDIQDLDNKEFVLRLDRAGVIDGNDNLFEGTRDISRVEFMKVLMRSHCIEYRNEDPSELTFIDLDNSTWEAKVITKALELGIANGDVNESGEEVFRSTDIISRAEAIKMLMRMALIQLGNDPKNTYTDITVDWHNKYVNQAENLGIINAQDELFNFAPDSGSSRYQTSVLLEKLLTLYR